MRCVSWCKRLSRWLILLTGSYLLFCAMIYCLQLPMLFPAYAAQPVPVSWQPRAGRTHDQIMLPGQCGKLHAVLWRIPDEKGTVMVFHGNGESMANVEDEVAEFQALGYSVMGWDYPGYGRSDGCWFSERELLLDAETAYQWLRRQTSAAHIVLYGHSVGTGLALYIASRHPGHRVLLVSPYDALVNVARDQMPWYVPVSWLIRYPLDAERWVGQVRGSIHAVHGLADTLILPQRAAALMRKAHGNAEIEWIPGADHNDLGRDARYHHWLASQLSSP